LLGLLHQVRLATATTLVVERALKAGLGNDYHDRIDAELRRAYDPTTSWSQLALIWPRRPHHLDRLCDIEYARIAGAPLHVDIIRLAGDRAARSVHAGVVVLVPGGAWVIGNKRQQGRLLLHELASAGWIGVAIEYRLSPRATFPAHLHDVKRALAWVKAH